MLKPQSVPPVPEMTARAAHAAFPKGHRYLTLRDELQTIFTDEMFADLFPKVGQPAEAPWRLALVLIVQHAEGLSDREAADAVRDRITLRYLLSLEYEYLNMLVRTSMAPVLRFLAMNALLDAGMFLSAPSA